MYTCTHSHHVSVFSKDGHFSIHSLLDSDGSRIAAASASLSAVQNRPLQLLPTRPVFSHIFQFPSFHCTDHYTAMSGGSANTSDGHLIWAFLLTCTTIGIVVRYVCTRLHLQIPYTSVLLVVFTILGLVQLGHSELDAASNAFAAFDPDLLQYIFLPLLCLETTLGIDVRNFIRLFPVILLLLVPGLAITAILTAVLVDHGMPAYQWDLSAHHTTHILFTAILPITPQPSQFLLSLPLKCQTRLHLLIAPLYYVCPWVVLLMCLLPV